MTARNIHPHKFTRKYAENAIPNMYDVRCTMYVHNLLARKMDQHFNNVNFANMIVLRHFSGMLNEIKLPLAHCTQDRYQKHNL